METDCRCAALPAAEVEEVKTRRLVHMQTLADRACPTEGYLRRGEHSAEVFEITRVQVASTRAEAEVHSCAHAGAEGFCPCSSVAGSPQVEREAVLLHGRMCFATPTERPHFLQASDTHMWRLKSERLDPSLAGQDIFSKQSPLDRCVPLWGGLSEGGFSIVTFHQKKKLTKAEWVQLLKAGKVVSAVQSLRPVKAHGPWHVLCDNESFLNAAECHAQYRKLKLHLWQIPPRSPDLNPIERFWAYLRKRLRKLDLQDALRGRPVLGKRAYKARVRTVVKSVHAQTVAKQIAKGYMKTCREVVRKGGAASSG